MLTCLYRSCQTESFCHKFNNYDIIIILCVFIQNVEYTIIMYNFCEYQDGLIRLREMFLKSPNYLA